MFSVTNIHYFWFLLLIPVIIALHIRQLLRRTVLFPSVAVWQKVAREAGKSGLRSFMRDLAGLILKTGAVASAVCALAGIEFTAETQGREIYLLDATSSMSRTLGTDTTPFEKAAAFLKNRSLPDSRILLVSSQLTETNAEDIPGFPGQSETVTASAVPRIQGLRKGDTVHVLSDHMPGADASFQTDTVWRSFGGKVENTGIRHALLTGDRLYVSLISSSDKPVSVSLEAAADMKTVFRKEIEISGQAEAVFELPPGTASAEISIVSGGGGYEGDDYCCVLNREKDPHVFWTGDSADESVVRFFRASGYKVTRTQARSKKGINVIQGPVPDSLPKGAYLLIAPLGQFQEIRFEPLSVPVAGVLEARKKTALTAYADLKGNEVYSLACSVRGPFAEVFSVDNKPACGTVEADGYKMVFFLFTPDENPDFTHTPAFAVLMQNVLSFLDRSNGSGRSLLCGEQTELSPGIYTLSRMGKEQKDFRIDRLSGTFTPETPGLYSVDRKAVLAVNTGIRLDDIEGKAGVSEFAAEVSDLSEIKSRELYPLFITACIILLSVLVYANRT